MAGNERSIENVAYYERIISASMKLGFIALLITLSYLILKPFLIMVLWGIIIAVGIYPFFRKLSAVLGGREKLAAVLITLTALAIIIVPSLLLLDSTINGIRDLAQRYQAGTLVIAPPNEKVAHLPIVGKSIYEIWYLASTNIEAAIIKLQPQIEEYFPEFVGAVTGLGGTILLSLVSIIIAGVLLVKSDSAARFTHQLFNFLIGKDGEAFTRLAGLTISSVVQGVLGIAAIQSISGGIIMLTFGIPAAGLWALIILVLAIIQLPLLLVMLPLSIYGFSIMDTTQAVLFLILNMIISVSDNILKPVLLGRGVDVPMMVILLGAIGGMLAFGILGLFVGAVILALAYKTLMAMIVEESPESQSAKNRK
jgi:predicted PurR-regulated permease PerM